MFFEISSELLNNFEIKDKAREHSIKLSRNIIRFSSKAIRSIHRGEWAEAEQLIKKASNLNNEIRSVLESHPDIYYTGPIEGAQQEYAEAAILYLILKKKIIPGPSELDVEDPAYLLGLGDVVGELRRFILDLIRSQKVYEGEELLETMDEIYTNIILFDYPDALHKGLRRKADVARSLVERTRGDLTNAIGHARLKEDMYRLKKNLKNQYG
jgi:translin